MAVFVVMLMLVDVALLIMVELADEHETGGVPVPPCGYAAQVGFGSSGHEGSWQMELSTGPLPGTTIDGGLHL